MALYMKLVGNDLVEKIQLYTKIVVEYSAEVSTHICLVETVSAYELNQK